MAENDIMSTVSKLLEDPKALSKIINLMSALNVNTEKKAEENIPAKIIEDTSVEAIEPFDAENAIAYQREHKKGKNTELIYALKPYLSDKRREKIDKILSLWQIMQASGIIKG